MEIRPGSDCNGLVTGRMPGNPIERRLFDRLTGRTRPTAVVQVESGERLLRNNCGHSLIAQFNGQDAADCWRGGLALWPQADL